MKPAAFVDVIAWNAVSLLCPTHASSHADGRIRAPVDRLLDRVVSDD
jgi:hypothetical protein